ncbi:MAG: hypothetical protein OXG81_02920 [Acidobacteria bacterium]|nr:hypothetical protein [Acidobacteriota bacterium]
MAALLSKVATTTRRLEQRLSTTFAGDSSQIDIEADPHGPLRRQGALLLRKALIHLAAVLRANATNNVHSLAVQMRPILECAGQVVFIFHISMIAPGVTMKRERAREVLADYMHGDYYGKMISVARGEMSHEEIHKELLANVRKIEEDAAASLGMPKPRRRKGKTLRQADKVAPLHGGKGLYDFVSEYFRHGETNWRGPSSHGGVVSSGTVQDEFAFLGLLMFLADQVAQMNASAALCPVAGDSGDQWSRWVEPALAELRHVRESSKAIRDAAFGEEAEE